MQLRQRMSCPPLWHMKEAEKWENYLPCSYFGEYWCQHLLCNKEPDYANRTTGHSTVENLAPGVIQQIDSEEWVSE